MGEFPDGNGERDNVPISGESYTILEKAYPGALSQARIMNVSSYKPADNKFDYLEGSAELFESLAELKAYIISHPPELIITLGEYALRHLTGEYNIYQWRGSPLLYYNGIRLLPTHSPATILASRNELFTIWSFDLQKALDYQADKHTIYEDNFSILKDPISQRNAFEEILAAPIVTIDIETVKYKPDIIRCIGFGLSKTRSICFANTYDGFQQTINDLMGQISNPIYHNGLFDISALRYFNNITVPALKGDTMIAQHVLEPELPKGLDFLCSIYTWRPCYWAGIKFDEDSKGSSEKKSLDELCHYNCLDTVVTYEAYEKMMVELSTHQSKHIYDYEIEMCEVAMHISSTGFTVDEERRKLLQTALESKQKADYLMLTALAGKVVLVSSHQQVKKYLYETLGLPTRTDRKGNVTSGEDALVNLIGYCKGERDKRKTVESKNEWNRKIAILKLILNIRGYDKLLSSYLTITIPADGRVRSFYKVPGTETGRWAAALWLDESGLNAMTLPRESIEV